MAKRFRGERGRPGNSKVSPKGYLAAGAGDPTVQDRLRKLKQVERMQRTFRDKFYTRPLPSQIPELQRELDAYLDHYNRRRPHRALGGLAPLEYLARIRGEAVPTESQMPSFAT